jgi:hypothetical protein
MGNNIFHDTSCISGSFLDQYEDNRKRGRSLSRTLFKLSGCCERLIYRIKIFFVIKNSNLRVRGFNSADVDEQSFSISTLLTYALSSLCERSERNVVHCIVQKMRSLCIFCLGNTGHKSFF